MRLIYILISSFFLLLSIIAYYNYRRKRLGLRDATIWIGAFLVLSVSSLSPGLVDLAIGMFGLKLKVNFLVFVLCVVTSAFIFFQLSTNNKLDRELSQLTQSLGIQRFFVQSLIAHGAGMEKKKNVLVKMAAYNEGKNIGRVLERMPGNVDILVVDDCSSDETEQIASKYGAMVVRHEKNMGQGIGDLTGFRVAFELGYDYIIEMDADGQHDPGEIPVFIEALQENPEVDIVVGSRILGSQKGQVCNVRRTFLPLYTRVINSASGYELTDAMCGYKAYRASSLLKDPHVLEELLETEYIAAELYIRFGRAGLKVKEIPVHIKERKYGKSHKGMFRYGFAVAWVVLRALLNRR